MNTNSFWRNTFWQRSQKAVALRAGIRTFALAEELHQAAHRRCVQARTL